MNLVELRYKIFKALRSDVEVDWATLVSPVPGHPVRIRLSGDDGRHFTVTIQED